MSFKFYISLGVGATSLENAAAKIFGPFAGFDAVNQAVDPWLSFVGLDITIFGTTGMNIGSTGRPKDLSLCCCIAIDFAATSS
tara:strand:- start:64 stop:312 length:249 start_codon:yes stop_codon:yes gene_type:complete